MDDNTRIFRERLRAARLRRGISGKTLAQLCALRESTISDYERGAVLPQLRTIYLLADALQVDPGWLVGGKAR